MDALYPISIAFALAMAVTGLYDLKMYKIPNSFILVLLALFLVRGLTSPAATPLVPHLIAGGATLLVAMALYGIGVFGGGDAKLLGVTALWFGLNSLTDLLGLIAVMSLIFLALFLAAVMVFGTGGERRSRQRGWSRLGRRFGMVPFAPPVAMAAIAFIIQQLYHPL
jgi:prepilin peptidase CpaA